MFGFTDVRCLCGFHSWDNKLLSYRTIRLKHGIWTMRRECRRCEAKLLIEGPAAEIAAGIRSR